MRGKSDLSLEVVVLLILGVFMLLFGLLLFKIHTGDLPYNPDSAYGLFLVIVSFQVITMGKTPFGDLRRSWALIAIGICAGIVGMAACFIPGYMTKFVSVLVGILLFAGGIVLFAQLCASEKKARVWMKTAGILRQLTVACGLVYVLTFFSGIMTLFPGVTSNPQTAALLIAYGFSFFYLSWCIWKIERSYPPEKPNDHPSKARFRFFREASLPLLPAIIILLGILITFLGFLLFPVNLGLLPFSPDGQLGLLLTIMAIQIMALGDTPLGQYKRSWFIVILGIAFAALGVVSCVVPGLLTGMLQTLLGLLNIIGGLVLLIKRFFPVLHEIKTPSATPVIVPLIYKKLSTTQTALNSVGIAFGISMLIPTLIPGLVIAAILVINGLILFRLATFLQKMPAKPIPSLTA